MDGSLAEVRWGGVLINCSAIDCNVLHYHGYNGDQVLLMNCSTKLGAAD